MPRSAQKILRYSSGIDALFLLPSALGADAADFGAAHRNVDAAVARDLLLQLLVELAFHFANLAAAQTRHMDVVARSVAFVEVAVAAEMQQVELVDEAVALQQV